MKKILIVLIGLFLVVGCSMGNKTPKMKVESYLENYKNQSPEVEEELENNILQSDWTDDQKEVYEKVLTKQYSDLKYEIVEENINGDEAVVTAQITVYDLYKAQNDADDYLLENRDEFTDDEGIYDENLFLDYKLKKMQETTDTVDYTLSFSLTKVDDNWTINEVTNDMLEKIHGIYNYESEE